MKVSLIILAVLLVTGAVLWLHEKRWRRLHAGENEPEEEAPAEQCCGMHITCEKDSLLAGVSKEIEYYDDEELDRFAGRGADSYADDEIEQFRDVLLTMRPDDIAGWARSVQLRGIILPQPVRDELIMIVAEARAARTAQHV